MTSAPKTVTLLFAFTAGTAAIGGCSGGNEPPRFDLQGSVSFAGAPIPSGSITLIPDAKRDNRGPATVATIENGEYTTPRGKGVLGGAYLVRIAGYDGVPVDIPGEGVSEAGRPVFPVRELRVDLPFEPGTIDFAVPVDGD
jgi:hypothetical protein